ncbi:uncharacterized protein LOC18435951 [Amborella trichopoda]|uniref:Putative zinc-finger domain-containing protein n=1 Tax=Amborella trichopoda TaxID=13333 RepID=W1PJ95_AMBTC|nr:uncharacterized protein LOC18435951 [Amborella trichopoda]ERN07716.1 hypothetical protein AMTR_s00012p00030740 [Amborella trichopoda]|eukprot:XP_006846041.1 uncharacterized protein LOC18435951 [Amborella trichopoda]
MEIEELRAKALASMGYSQNPNSKPKDEGKEEGELSSEETEIPASAPPSTSIQQNRNQLTAVSGTVPAKGLPSSVNVQTRTGRAAISSGRRFVAPANKLSATQISGRPLSFNDDNNLVIRFTDSESESDPDEETLDKTHEANNGPHSNDTPQNSAASKQVRLATAQQNVHSKASIIRKKFSFIRKPGLCKTSVPATSCEGHVVERELQIPRENVPRKVSTKQKSGSFQGVEVPDNNFETLRQQIAMRENQVMLQHNSLSKVREVHERLDKRPQVVLKKDGSEDPQVFMNKNRPRDLDSMQWKGSTKENVLLINNALKETNVQEGRHSGRVPVQLGSVLVPVKDAPTSCVLSCTKTINCLPIKRKNCDFSRTCVSEDFSQAEKRARAMLPSAPVNGDLRQKLMVSRAEDVPLCQHVNYAINNFGYPVSSMAQRKGSHLHGQPSSVDRGAVFSDEALANIPDELSGGVAHMQESKVKISEQGPAILEKHEKESLPLCSSLLSDREQLNLSGNKNLTVQSLMRDEELLDKELEDAQEHRRMCELQERKALKAYREAQRNLVDANSRCSSLYKRRETISLQLQAYYVTETCSLLEPSKGCGARINEQLLSSNLSNTKLDNLAPGSSLMKVNSKVPHQGASEENPQCLDNPTPHSYQCGQDCENDTCAEVDLSKSKLLHKNNSTAVGVTRHFNISKTSTDHGQKTSPFEHEAMTSGLLCQSKEESPHHVTGEQETQSRMESFLSCSHSMQDSITIEASLRSKLLERRGIKTSVKDIGFVDGGEHTSCSFTQGNHVENEKSHGSFGALPVVQNQLLTSIENPTQSSEGTKMQCERPGYNVYQVVTNVSDQLHRGRDYSCGGDDPDYTCSSAEKSGQQFLAPLASPGLKILFSYANVTRPEDYRGPITCSEATGNCAIHILHDTTTANPYENPLGGFSAHGIQNGENGTCLIKLAPDFPDYAIDPFWPFCKFELRGKCNDDECPWQHARDYLKRDSMQRNDSTSSEIISSTIDNNRSTEPKLCNKEPFRGETIHMGSQNHSLLHLGDFRNSKGLSWTLRCDALSIPVYQVGSNLIKADMHQCGSMLAHSTWRYWQLGFCSSLSVPFALRRNPLWGISSLDEGSANDEDYAIRGRLSMYIRTQDVVMKQVMQGLGDIELSLELALGIFHGQGNKLQRRKKALFVISRALEENPTCVPLWIVYLHLYYKKEKSIGKDDMFLQAVRHCKSSYELWLLFINSRPQILEQIHAYNTALSALCHASNSNEEDSAISACILDLFLRMLHLSYMSGDIKRAISIVFEPLCTETHTEDTIELSLSYISSCLTIYDRCILWVSSAYLAVYGKLPGTIVERFEFKQELPFGLEWPSIELAKEEKHRVLELMDAAVDDLHSIKTSQSPQESLVSTHALCVSHVRCMAALEGLDMALPLVEKYKKMYPACIELVLISAHLHRDCLSNYDFEAFEESLNNWPKESHGVQRIWHQYASYVLETKGVGFAEKLMNRWFQSHDSLNACEQGICPDSRSFHPTSNKCIFGLLNLATYKLLKKDWAEAQATVDKALKLSCGEDFKHCLKEHASLNNHGKPNDEILGLLSRYLRDARVLPVPEPLSRGFLVNTRRPRLRQVIKNILGPVPPDFSLLNSILEVWYGPSLLPESLGMKGLVDFVEVLMDIVPSNYKLALMVCKFVSRSYNPVDVASTSAMFWACSTLVNSLVPACPLATERSWVETAELLGVLEMESLSERFHRLAISVYPFSLTLWKSYLTLCKTAAIGNADAIIEAAKERGITLTNDIILGI